MPNSMPNIKASPSSINVWSGWLCDSGLTVPARGRRDHPAALPAPRLESEGKVMGIEWAHVLPVEARHLLSSVPVHGCARLQVVNITLVLQTPRASHG